MPFDFFGFGQQVQHLGQQQNHAQEENNAPEDQAQWGQWLQAPVPDAAPAALGPDAVPEAPLVDTVPEAPVIENPAGHQLGGFDLNQEPIQPDVMEIDAQEARLGQFDLNVDISDSENQLNMVQWLVIEEEMDKPIADFNMPLMQNVQLPIAEEEVALMAIMDNQAMGLIQHEAYIELNDLQPQNEVQEADDINDMLNDIQAMVQGPNNDEHPDIQGHDLQFNQHVPQNLQIGWMEFQDTTGADPIFESFTISDHPPKASNYACSIRLWAKHFAPIIGSSKIAMISEEWAAFFNVLLLSPDHFEWVKKLLQPDALTIINQAPSTGNYLSYALPSICPNEQALSGCIRQKVALNITELEASSEEEEEDTQETSVQAPPEKTPQSKVTSASTSQLQVRHNKVTKKPLVETDVRRSQRLKSINKGYKGKTCTDKECLYCAVEALTMSQKVIRNLGEAFCKIDPRDLSDDALAKKSRKVAAVKKLSSSRAGKTKEGKDEAKKQKTSKKHQKKD